MVIYVKKLFYFHIVSFFSGFITWSYQMRWFYPYRSSNWAGDDVTN